MLQIPFVDFTLSPSVVIFYRICLMSIDIFIYTYIYTCECVSEHPSPQIVGGGLELGERSNGWIVGGSWQWKFRSKSLFSSWQNTVWHRTYNYILNANSWCAWAKVKVGCPHAQKFAWGEFPTKHKPNIVIGGAFAQHSLLLASSTLLQLQRGSHQFTYIYKKTFGLALYIASVNFIRRPECITMECAFVLL